MKYKNWIIGIAVIILIGGIYISKYNKIKRLEQNVKAQWSKVESAYQRRLDLIPNLVNTVKGYAEFEKETLTQVIEARAKATSVTVDPANLNQASIQQFQQTQGALSSALGRLMVVVEKYPDLKANQNFLELQAQLEGTENRIKVERDRYTDQVSSYNKYVVTFFNQMLFHKEEMGYFTADEAASQAPTVEF
ncbi:MAG: LemA family protein [Bacteroidales bacterium]|nr:LemA family protein [Bacteroidales bacterium]MBN2819427.1 LemA family protein [Bacteroidales bacterium]